MELTSDPFGTRLLDRFDIIRGLGVFDTLVSTQENSVTQVPLNNVSLSSDCVLRSHQRFHTF